MTNIKVITLKFGGSVLYNEAGDLDVIGLQNFCQMVEGIYKMGLRVSIVVGGGKATRKLVNALLPLEFSNGHLDHLSILMTQLHATIIQMYLGQKYPVHLVKNYDELFSLNTTQNEIIIAGGFYPGQSTNGAAATVAEVLHADLLVNFFGYDHISSEDPTEDKVGSQLTNISYAYLTQLSDSFAQRPGHYELFDHNALNIVTRSKISVLFLNGKKPIQVVDYLKGKKVGTLVN